MNAYVMLTELRENLAEATAGHWSDKSLLRKLNLAHRSVLTRFLQSNGDWFLTKTALTPSASLITLPSDCEFPVYMEETSGGYEIPIRGTVRERRLTRMAGTSLSAGMVEAYLYGDYLEVNVESYSEGVTLWYQPRVPDLHAGALGSGTSATALVFQKASWPNGADDYYNGAYVEVIDVTDYTNHGKFLVTDYVGSTATATVAGASAVAAGDFYGTISKLPEWGHNLVVMMATMSGLAKPGSTLEKEIFTMFSSLYKQENELVDRLIGQRIHNARSVTIREEYDL